MGFVINERQRLNNIVVVELVGSVDMGTVDTLAAKLESVHKSGTKKIVLDMKGLESFSSAGWGCLVEWKHKYQTAGGDMQLACVNEAQQHVFELMGLDAVFQLYPDVGQAVSSLSGEAK